MPVWALLPVTWIPWTAILFAVNLASGDSLLPAFELAAVGGVVLAVATTLPLKFRWRAERRALGEATQTDRTAAIRAARTGPVPADPEVRAGALRLAQTDLQRPQRWRPWMAVAGLVFVAGQIGLAFSSPWSLSRSGARRPVVRLLVVRLPKRPRTRIALLSEPQEPVLRTQ
ncbi:hypothetical protein F1D05_00125 [Kribbella qitaiheensis]|uniref:Uncharacterized protein n=1 Tax=Kribbella qitaiheensis TaxID=1544730 RepID=A0A7G6WRI2_9ACTN|nr:hypothetical protein [Kribbella qitaiheensis]QNE16597.1 hypothetical protein F1D05_00125 [Kribbella qitaiheensis]